ncbi:MAG: hypothetical protein K5872_14970 [Rhizobiaceae bacterium]|nr:hypothetical protein [Rhizobiaceae bacterium]MCV0407524.1 hypothetical protein [Rhizobiaceae bacterium]
MGQDLHEAATGSSRPASQPTDPVPVDVHAAIATTRSRELMKDLKKSTQPSRPSSMPACLFDYWAYRLK